MKLAPMLSSIGSLDDLNRPDFIYEPKLDGIRALCFVDGHLRFFSRNGIDITHQFPEFNWRPRIKAKKCVLDGEIVAYDAQGIARFELLQTRRKQKLNTAYVVFDILYKNSKSLIDLPLLERKKILEKTVRPDTTLDVMVFTKDGEKLWKLIKKKRGEGILAKKIDAHYEPGVRVRHWLKIKEHQTIDCVIIGFTQKNRLVSSLALGVYDKGTLTYIGKVGTGFNQEDLVQLSKKFQPLLTQKPTIAQIPKGTTIIWLKPQLVAEISFVQITKQKRLRIPVFVRLRNDKKVRDCTFKQ